MKELPRPYGFRVYYKAQKTKRGERRQHIARKTGKKSEGSKPDQVKGKRRKEKRMQTYASCSERLTHAQKWLSAESGARTPHIPHCTLHTNLCHLVSLGQ